MSKIRYTPTDGELKAQTREWSKETDNAKFHIPAIPVFQNLKIFLENREGSQIAEPLCTSGTTLGNMPDAPNAPVQCKSTH